MCAKCDHSDAPHSVEAQRTFPVYQSVVFAACSLAFVWCANGAASLDAARNLPPGMDGSSDHGQAARERAAAEVQRVCKGKPLAVKVCAEDIRKAYERKF